ncbi:hypothetical protein PENTCL1PPCAC_7133, partial [Pristionchus entomophagus]
EEEHEYPDVGVLAFLDKSLFDEAFKRVEEMHAFRLSACDMNKRGAGFAENLGRQECQNCQSDDHNLYDYVPTENWNVLTLGEGIYQDSHDHHHGHHRGQSQSHCIIDCVSSTTEKQTNDDERSDDKGWSDHQTNPELRTTREGNVIVQQAHVEIGVNGVLIVNSMQLQCPLARVLNVGPGSELGIKSEFISGIVIDHDEAVVAVLGVEGKSIDL